MQPFIHHPADPRLTITQQGSGRVHVHGEEVTLALLPEAARVAYHNAQISDYDPRRQRFALRPPLHLVVEASAAVPAGGLRGTAGFGFWNHTFTPTGRGFRLPQTAWFFFASDESDMALARGVAGRGWKAATMDAQRWRARLLLPLAPFAIPLMRVPALYRRLYPLAQRVLGVHEAALDPALLAARHRYELRWLPRRLEFCVDGARVLAVDDAPRGALGFIAWIDNQYAIVTPQGRFGAGLCALGAPQALTLHSLNVAKP